MTSYLPLDHIDLMVLWCKQLHSQASFTLGALELLKAATSTHHRGQGQSLESFTA